MRKLTVGSFAAFLLATSGSWAAENLASVQKRMADFRTRIDAGKADKSLTANEAARVDADYNDIARMIAAAKADGKVSDSELKAIHGRQEALNKAIYAGRHNAQLDLASVNKRMPDFRTRIDTGKADKSLTSNEAAKLDADYFDIAKMIAEAKSDGTVTDSEIKAIHDRQEALNKAIYAGRHNAQLNLAGVQKRMPDFRTRIDAGKADKSLTSNEAARIDADYFDIARMIADAKSDGTVTDSELKAIHDRQEALNKAIYAGRHN